jgi:uncharacterized protein with ATP-grasp and redox domains
MRVEPDCIPCYLKQSISTLRVAGVEEKEINGFIYNVLDMIPLLDLEATPCENSSIILHKVYELLGDRDPYKDAKKQWNNYALNQYQNFVSYIEKSDDRLLAALKVSVAGNIIDMGITPDFDIDLALNEITGKEFDYSDYEQFKEMLNESQNILFIGDNSGEIVFDKVLVEELLKRGKRVVYAVKSNPILNDATFEDAEQVGLASICEITGTGNKMLGVSYERCSHEFLTALKKADIVISKGQANFESMEGSSLAGSKTFFILRAKCPLVARCLGVKLGDIVLQRNRS